MKTPSNGIAQSANACSLIALREALLAVVCVDASGFQVSGMKEGVNLGSPIPIGTHVTAGNPEILLSSSTGVLSVSADATRVTLVPSATIESAPRVSQ